MRGDYLKKEWQYLLEAPYNFDVENVEWVQRMIIKEKAAQLFIVLNDKKEGIRYRNIKAHLERVWKIIPAICTPHLAVYLPRIQST